MYILQPHWSIYYHLQHIYVLYPHEMAEKKEIKNNIYILKMLAILRDIKCNKEPGTNFWGNIILYYIYLNFDIVEY